jgi:hypothetical protein
MLVCDMWNVVCGYGYVICGMLICDMLVCGMLLLICWYGDRY